MTDEGRALCNQILSVSAPVHSHKCQLKVNFVVYQMHVNNLIENQSALLIANVNWQCCGPCLPVNDSSTSQGGKNRMRELIAEGIEGRDKFWRIFSYFSISRLPTTQHNSSCSS